MFALPTSNRQVFVTLWRLGGPIAFQSLIAATLGLLDTFMVSGVSTAALGGVGVISRILFVLTMILAGLSSGTGALVAQYSGARRLRAARGPILLAVLLGVALTLPMSLVSLFGASGLASLLSPDPQVVSAASIFLMWSAFYGPLTAVTMTLSATLRSTGNARAPMLAGISGLAVNTILNYLFIGGHLGFPAFGIAAAAVATSTARLVELGFLIASLKAGSMRRLHQGIFMKHARLVLVNAVPLMLKEVAWAGGVLASTLIISQMGAVPLAAYNFALPVEAILISLLGGSAVATGILLGNALGASAFEAAFDAARRILRLVSFSALLLGVMAALLAQIARINDWFADVVNPTLLPVVLNVLSVLFLGFGARAHNAMVSIGILRSGNDSTWLMVTDLCSMWLINVPLVAFCALVLHWPLVAVVAVMMMEEVLKVAVFRHRVKSKKWLKKL